jgi:hypothetical protein
MTRTTAHATDRAGAFALGLGCASAGPDDLAPAVGPTLDRYLTGPLAGLA